MKLISISNIFEFCCFSEMCMLHKFLFDGGVTGVNPSVCRIKLITKTLYLAAASSPNEGSQVPAAQSYCGKKIAAFCKNFREK